MFLQNFEYVSLESQFTVDSKILATYWSSWNSFPSHSDWKSCNTSIAFNGSTQSWWALPWSKSQPAVVVAATCLLAAVVVRCCLLQLCHCFGHTAEKQQLTAAEITQAKDLQGGMGPKGLRYTYTLCEKSRKNRRYCWAAHNDSTALLASTASSKQQAASSEQQMGLALNRRLAVFKLQSSLMCERAWS